MEPRTRVGTPSSLGAPAPPNLAVPVVKIPAHQHEEARGESSNHPPERKCVRTIQEKDSCQDKRSCVESHNFSKGNQGSTIRIPGITFHWCPISSTISSPNSRYHLLNATMGVERVET